jgi:hypothetical protein
MTASRAARPAGGPPRRLIPAASMLTQRQMRSLETLPAEYEVLSLHGPTPLIRRGRDGELLRMRRSGRLVATLPVAHVRSYLHLHG